MCSVIFNIISVRKCECPIGKFFPLSETPISRLSGRTNSITQVGTELLNQYTTGQDQLSEFLNQVSDS